MLAGEEPKWTERSVLMGGSLTLMCIRISRIQWLRLGLELRYECIQYVMLDMSIKVELKLGTVRTVQ